MIADGRPKSDVCIPIKNDFDCDVIFDGKILRSCSCSEVELKSKKISPGEQTELVVSINLIGRSGLQTIGVTLTDSIGREWWYEIELMVFPQSRFSGWNETIRFQNSEPGDLIIKNIPFEVYAFDPRELPADLELKVEGTKALALIKKTSQVQEVAKGIWVRRFDVQLECSCPFISGPFYGELMAKYKLGNEDKRNSTNLTGYVNSLLETTPSYVFLARF